ncbi:MAG: hypothetical protein WBC59_00535 [Phycisphaerae bacterium]
MPSQLTPDFAFENLVRKEALIAAAEGCNEADTRLRAIDTIIFDVLGWDKRFVNTEKYNRPGYVDYAFLHGDSVCLILEAKRSGTTFLLPNRQYTNAPVGFALLAEECEGALGAMAQACAYATQEGSRYVAISNGHQWLLMLTFVQDQPLRERLVYVFQSVADIKSRFAHFWSCFAPEGLYSNAQAAGLLESRKAPAPAKLSATITGYPVPADRNILVNELGYVLGMVWDETNQHDDDPDFLRKCYILPEAAEDSIALAKELLEQRRSTDDLASVEVVDSGNISEIMAKVPSERPIVVLGAVGHGKSIFLKYLRRVKARDALSQYMQLDVDFLDRPDSGVSVGSHIYGTIEQELLDRYDVDIREAGFVRGCLHGAIERFKRTVRGRLHPPDSQEFQEHELDFIEHIQKDPHIYLTHVVRHLKLGRDRSVALFFDNLDRRLDPIQEAAFLCASAIARDWACLVFICLRPDTYFRSRQEGVLDSVAPKSVVVSSPRIPPLLRKRFQYAVTIAKGSSTSQDGHTRGAPTRDVTVNLPSVAAFLECCDASVHKNKDLAAFFEAVSNGNARDVLRYTYQFITSQQLNTAKILEKLEGGYTIPVHEALRALLYGDYRYYDPEQSMFVNLFDIERADPMEHFSRFLVLRYLHLLSASSVSARFCLVNDLVKYLCQMGFSGEHARATLQFLYLKKCCVAPVPGLKWVELEQGKLRITSLGRYHVTYLVNTFQYLDAMVVDTPIIDEEVRAQIADTQHIVRRLDRTEIFITYLDKSSQNLQDADAVTAWSEPSRLVRKEIREIRESTK